MNNLAAERSKLGLAAEYDRTCASISKEESDDRAAKGEAHVVRFKAPATPPEFRDIIYGKVGSGKVNRNIGQAYDDLILIKTDGWPTYHLANVVDDHLMDITHVVRGTEWMISTPKHIALYDAFGWTPPAFAHVGLLQDPSGAKLSKRRGDIDIASFRKRGILPEALANFLALLGWSGHGGGNEFMSMETLKNNVRALN